MDLSSVRREGSPPSQRTTHRVHGKNGVPVSDATDLLGRSALNPTGLYLGEFWEQQMVGEKDIDLDQKSGLLDRGDEVPK